MVQSYCGLGLLALQLQALGLTQVSRLPQPRSLPVGAQYATNTRRSMTFVNHQLLQQPADLGVLYMCSVQGAS